MRNVTTTLMILATSSLLMACSSDDSIIFDKRLGPVTSQQIKALPQTLDGDTKNARHTSYTLEGKGMKDPKGVDE